MSNEQSISFKFKLRLSGHLDERFQYTRRIWCVASNIWWNIQGFGITKYRNHLVYLIKVRIVYIKRYILANSEKNSKQGTLFGAELYTSYYWVIKQ